MPARNVLPHYLGAKGLLSCATFDDLLIIIGTPPNFCRPLPVPICPLSSIFWNMSVWCVCRATLPHHRDTLFPSNSLAHRISSISYLAVSVPSSSRLPRDVMPQPTRLVCGVEHEFLIPPTACLCGWHFKRRKRALGSFEASILGHPALKVNHLLAATDRPFEKRPDDGMSSSRSSRPIPLPRFFRGHGVSLPFHPFKVYLHTPIQSGPTPHLLLRSSVHGRKGTKPLVTTIGPCPATNVETTDLEFAEMICRCGSNQRLVARYHTVYG